MPREGRDAVQSTKTGGVEFVTISTLRQLLCPTGHLKNVISGIRLRNVKGTGWVINKPQVHAYFNYVLNARVYCTTLFGGYA